MSDQVREIILTDASGNQRKITLDAWRDGHLHSVVEFDVGARLKSRLPFFQYTQSQRVPVVTTPGGTLVRRQANLHDTNMPRKSRIQNTEEFIIFTAWLDVDALTDDIIVNSPGSNRRALAPIPSGYNLKWFHFSSIFGVYLGAATNKPYMRAPVGYWPPGTDALYGTSGDAGSVGTAEQSLGSMGLSGGKMLRRTLNPIHVDSTQKILGALDFPRTGTPIPASAEVPVAFTPAMTYTQAFRVHAYLRGIRKLPVQPGQGG